jgi:hypothetical protein
MSGLSIYKEAGFMSPRPRNPSRAIASSRIPAPLFEQLENRQLLAAHIVGSSINYATIQAAVDAAAPNATVTVDAGVYEEAITIGVPLTLKGSRAGVDARDSSRGGLSESIIRGVVYDITKRSNAIFVAANNVTIDGFTIQDQTGAAGRGAGLVMSGGVPGATPGSPPIVPAVFGTRVINNIIQSNSSGIYLANSSSTVRALIQRNVISENNNPGTNNGRGVYSDGDISGGNLTNVLIDDNTFISNVGDGTSGNPEAAVGLEAQTAGKQSNITISNNVMDKNGKGVLAFNVTGLAITGNTITNSTDGTSAAIRLEGNVKTLLVQNNSIANNKGAAIRVTQRFLGLSSGIVIKNNNITGNVGGGLIVDGTSMADSLDARNNWWGSSTGPGGDGAGSGQSVVANGNSVLYSPWLKSPASVPSPRTVPQRVIDFLKSLQAKLATSSNPLAQRVADFIGAILNYLATH